MANGHHFEKNVQRYISTIIVTPILMKFGTLMHIGRPQLAIKNFKILKIPIWRRPTS